MSAALAHRLPSAPEDEAPADAEVAAAAETAEPADLAAASASASCRSSSAMRAAEDASPLPPLLPPLELPAPESKFRSETAQESGALDV